MDLAFAADEDEHVTRAFAPELGDRVADGLHLITVVFGRDPERTVANLHGVRASGDLDDRHGCGVAREVVRESPGVDRGRGDDHLQVGPRRQELREVAEQKVDVEAALVGLVDDERVVAPEHAVTLQLGEQDAVGHHADQRVLADLVVEPHGEPDCCAERRTELVGHPCRNRACRDTARLCMADQTVDATAGGEAQLRELRALAGSGLAGDDHNLVITDGRDELIAMRGNGQRRRYAEVSARDDRAEHVASPLHRAFAPFVSVASRGGRSWWHRRGFARVRRLGPSARTRTWVGEVDHERID